MTTVLLLAPGDDGEAGLVAEHAQARDAMVAWFDTSEFPQASSVTAELSPGGWSGRITTAETTIDLADITAVYYRQPRPFTLPPGMAPDEQRFARVEGRFGIGGLLASLPARWVPGAPGRVADGEYKPLQLATASRCGLTPPATLLTNDSKAAHAFSQSQCDGAVYKALMHKLLTGGGESRLIYTTAVDAGDIDKRVATTVHQFQANLAQTKLYDARLVATRRRQLCIAIYARNHAARQDFRVDYDHLTYRQIDIPARVADGCHRYLEALDLHLGVFDFCVTPDNWYFLECGPGAQWAWLQEATNAPIADLIAEELTLTP